jgi:hypothetical protein
MVVFICIPKHRKEAPGWSISHWKGGTLMDRANDSQNRSTSTAYSSLTPVPIKAVECNRVVSASIFAANH